MGILKFRAPFYKLLLFCAVLVILFSPAYARSGQSTGLFEQKIKAGLVYNFLKYTVWPGSTLGTQALNVCLLGGEALDGYLLPLKGRTAQQATISISRIQNVDESAKCNLVFVPQSHENLLPELFAFTKDKPVLTVSDIERFAKRGGMVELTTDNQHVGIAVNKNAIDRSGLSVQDRLLKLAKLVSGDN